MNRLIIFALLGPIAGLLAFAFAIAIFGLLSKPQHSLADTVGVFLVTFIAGLPLSFLLGTVPAILAGAIFIPISNIISKRYRQQRWIYPALGAAIGFTVSTGLTTPTHSKELMGLLIFPSTVAGALLGWRLRPILTPQLAPQVWATTEPTDTRRSIYEQIQK
jgi:hypothetical protein